MARFTARPERAETARTRRAAGRETTLARRRVREHKVGHALDLEALAREIGATVR